MIEKKVEGLHGLNISGCRDFSRFVLGWTVLTMPLADKQPISSRKSRVGLCRSDPILGPTSSEVGTKRPRIKKRRTPERLATRAKAVCYSKG